MFFQASLLLDIWQDYHEENSEENMNVKLPEPPLARERLCEEIKFFVQYIKEKNNEE